MHESSQTQISSSPIADEEPLLSPQRAFVLQLYPETDIAHGRLAGRIEHILSGEAIQFDSMDGVLPFLAQILVGEGCEPKESRLRKSHS